MWFCVGKVTVVMLVEKGMLERVVSGDCISGELLAR